MLLKDLLYKCKWKIFLTSVSSTYNSTYTSVLQTNPCLTIQQCLKLIKQTQPRIQTIVDVTTNQFLDLIFQKKFNLVSLGQVNTVNHTDTVIDLNLITNHLIDHPFSMDQISDGYSQSRKNYSMTRYYVSLTTKNGLMKS